MEILNKYIESYGKKFADRGFRMQSDHDPRHTTKATAEVITRKSQACWTDLANYSILTQLACIETPE